ncbi:MAG: hypothetical protein HZB46_16175 [Solirubrobacterales bacterium]|nr:hypothetical protein [Solirubrobacterales bacterium]
MATEPQPLTLSQAVHRAVEACDPDGADERLADLLARFEDRDEPISALTDVEQQMDEATGALDPERDDPALTMAGAIVTYLAFRRDAVDNDDDRLIELAAEAEFHGSPPENVAAWLAA